MLATQPSPAPTQPDPTPDPTAEAASNAAEPTRSGKLLILIRKLIDYGRGLAETLGGRGTADNDTACRFGTADLALILRRITLGLQRAAALVARVETDAARLDCSLGPMPRLPAMFAAPRPKRPVRPAKLKPPMPAVEPDMLAQLPSVEEIAADIARRPIGAVLADICRDLGIATDNPMWHELYWTVLEEGGGSSNLLRHMIRRSPPVDHWQSEPYGPPPELWVRSSRPADATGPP